MKIKAFTNKQLLMQAKEINEWIDDIVLLGDNSIRNTEDGIVFTYEDREVYANSRRSLEDRLLSDIIALQRQYLDEVDSLKQAKNQEKNAETKTEEIKIKEMIKEKGGTIESLKDAIEIKKEMVEEIKEGKHDDILYAKKQSEKKQEGNV